MSQQSGRAPGQQAAGAAAMAAAAAQQLRYGAATPPVGQQFQTSNNAWANPAQLVQLQHGRVSPGPQPLAAGAQASALQLLQLQARGVLPPGAPLMTAQHLQVLLQQQQQQQQQQQAQAQLLRAAQQQQQQANQAGKRPVAVSAAGSAPFVAAKKHMPAPSVTSAGNVTALVQPSSIAQQAAARLGSAHNLAAVAGVGQRPLQAGALALQGMRPGVSIPAASGVLGVSTAGLLGATGIAQQAASLEARQHMALLKPGEQPRVQLPDSHEWVQCLGRDGQPTWVALLKVSANKYRAEQKRKADEIAGVQPATKVAAAAGVGSAVRRRIDDDYTAGAGDRALDVMADDELQAELAVNEAAKGAVQVQQGNVQEEYILNQGPTLQLIAAIAKQHGVRQVSEDLVAFLSLAADAHLSQLLHGLVKSRLQREDIGKSYQGVEKQEDNVRGRLFQIQKREKEAAKERAEKERDELAKLSGTRKKLAEEDKKAAKDAQMRKQLQMQQKTLVTTLGKMGIGRRTFGMSALGKSAGAAAAGAKAGFTKPELKEAKAEAADTAGAAALANGSSAAKIESASDANAQQQLAAGSAAGSATAAAVMAPPLKPVTLQHQLLTAANASGISGGGGPVSFVAGGVSSTGSKETPKEEEGLREIMLRDLIAVLERHPLYCRSQLLYSLYVLAGQLPMR